MVGMLYLYWMFLSTAVMSADLFRNGRILFRPTTVRLVTLFCVLYIIPSILNFQQGSLRSIERIVCFYVCFLFIYKHSKIHLNTILTSLSLVYGFFIAANFILFILFPNGLYSISHSTHHNSMLLGDDNAVIYVALPGLICLVCHSLQKFGRITRFVWFCIVSTVLTLIILWAASGMVCALMFAIFLLAHRYFDNKSPFWFFGGVVAAVIVCIFCLSVPVIANIIEGSLEKDITLSGRTFLWEQAFAYIAQKPLFGWGGYFLNGIFVLGRDLYYPCHTQYLQMIIDGGMVLFASYVALIIHLFSIMKKYYEKKSAYVLTIGLSFMMVNYITEWSPHNHFFIIAALISALPYYKRDCLRLI